MLMVLVFVAYMACVDLYANPKAKIFSRIAVLFACIAAGILFVNYFVQVTVIQPSLINGEYDGISILTQYNPHGIFIALEEAGYLLMSLSVLSLLPVFSGLGRIETWIRRIALWSFILTISALIGFTAIHGISREYRFEIAVITIDFFTLILLGVLSSFIFKRTYADNSK